MRGAVFSPCWLFGLRRPSTGANRLFGGAKGGLWEGSHQWVLPRTAVASVFVPTVSHSCPLPLQEIHSSRKVWPSLLWGHCSVPRVPMHTRPCVCPPRVEFLLPLPPSPVEALQSNPTDPQSHTLWGLLLLLPDPQAGKPDVGSALSLQWENFCGTIVLQSVGCPPGRYGTWFYCDCTPPTILSWLPLCPWM